MRELPTLCKVVDGAVGTGLAPVRVPTVARMAWLNRPCEIDTSECKLVLRMNDFRQGLQTLHIERRKYMRNIQSSSAGGYSEFSEKREKSIHQFEAKYYKPATESDQVMIDYLIDRGFAWEEAVTLLNMREHLYENVEMHQRMANDYRMQFVQWLYEHGEISDS
jgi:hypothetical protein